MDFATPIREINPIVWVGIYILIIWLSCGVYFTRNIILGGEEEIERFIRQEGSETPVRLFALGAFVFTPIFIPFWCFYRIVSFLGGLLIKSY